MPENEPAAPPPDPAPVAAGAEAPAADPLREALGKAEALAEENWNRYLRASAELENVRKRAARDVEQARKFAVERLAAEILPVLDTLEMGVEHAAAGGTEALLEGKKATLRLLQGTLQRFGIEAVVPDGAAFDPQLHEAISVQPSPAATPGTVLAVVQKGYQLNGRLLRPARVVVAAAPPEPAGDGDSPGAA